jgi:hypothetical protein
MSGWLAIGLVVVGMAAVAVTVLLFDIARGDVGGGRHTLARARRLLVIATQRPDRAAVAGVPVLLVADQDERVRALPPDRVLDRHEQLFLVVVLAPLAPLDRLPARITGRQFAWTVDPDRRAHQARRSAAAGGRRIFTEDLPNIDHRPTVS